jgi:hypothetical protein
LNIDIGKMWKYGTAKWQNDNAFQYIWRCVWESMQKICQFLL